MKNFKIIFVHIIFLIVFVFTLTCEAQINPVYKIMKLRGWISPLEKDLGKLTPDQYEKEVLVSMGYNDTTVTKLQKAGVNLLSLHKRSGHWNEKTWAALSDCIIIGTVSRIEHPFGEKSWFHTVAYVRVEEFLRNDYNLPKMQIPVLLVSGPTGTGQTAIEIGEDTLGIGEHVLLYLSACSLIRFASNNHMHNLYNQLINDSTIKFSIVAKFNIETGKVISRNRERNLNNVRSEIKTVLTTIHPKLSNK